MRSASEQNRRYFREAYESGRHGWESTEPSAFVVKNLAALAKSGTAGRLLDVGCGEGRHCILAAQLGFQPTGVDYEPKAIQRAKAKAREAGLVKPIKWLVADIFALHFASHSFDVVLDYGCLHHQRKVDWPRYRRIVTQLLTPTGYLLLSVFSTAFSTYGPQTRSWHLAYGAYRRFFTAEDLHQLFDRDFKFLRLEEEREGARGFWHVLLQRRSG